MSLQTKDIRLRLKGKPRARFEEIKAAKGLTNDTEVLRLLINEAYLDKMVLTDEFVEWFRARPHKPVMKLSEVVDEYELFKKQQQKR